LLQSVKLRDELPWLLSYVCLFTTEAAAGQQGDGMMTLSALYYDNDSRGQVRLLAALHQLGQQSSAFMGQP
jgi:hypothetical protein